MENNNNQQVSIELKPDVAGGNYSNLAIISHAKTEFVIDFAQMLPGLPKAMVCDRIIMNPEHAKRLLNALADNIAKYEAQFGPIGTDNAPAGTLNLAELMSTNGSKS